MELREDPNDYLANFLLRHVHVTQRGKDFVALYLFVAAIVNIVMCFGLLLHRKKMFPIAMAILAGFIAYQVFLFARVHSYTLVGLSIYDTALIYLIYVKYKRRWPTESQISTP